MDHYERNSIIIFWLFIALLLIIVLFPGLMTRLFTPADQALEKADEALSTPTHQSSQDQLPVKPEKESWYKVVEKSQAFESSLFSYYVYFKSDLDRIYELKLERQDFARFERGEYYRPGELPLMHFMERLRKIPEIVEKEDSLADDKKK